MPTTPESRDHGLLGPDSVAWRVVGHPAALIGGLRSLVIQSLNPLAMAGVAEHSDYQRRALHRLRRTAGYVAATTFGDTETAHSAARRVRNMHRKVRGTDPVTGQPYSADDPDTQVWVHVTEWESFLAAYLVYGGRLSREDRDRYHAEGVRIAALLGTPEERVPDSVDAVRAYYEEVRPRLCVSTYSREAISFVLAPPLTAELLPLQIPLRVAAGAARAIVPRPVRRIAGIDQPRAVDHATIAAVRPLLLPLATAPARPIMSALVGGRTVDMLGRRRAAAALAAPGDAVAA